MAETCGTTRGAGNNRAYEDAVNTRIEGDLQEVESDLPEDIRSVETRDKWSCLNFMVMKYIDFSGTLQKSATWYVGQICRVPFAADTRAKSFDLCQQSAVVRNDQ